MGSHAIVAAIRELGNLPDQAWSEVCNVSARVTEERIYLGATSRDRSRKEFATTTALIYRANPAVAVFMLATTRRPVAVTYSESTPNISPERSTSRVHSSSTAPGTHRTRVGDVIATRFPRLSSIGRYSQRRHGDRGRSGYA